MLFPKKKIKYHHREKLRERQAEVWEANGEVERSRRREGKKTTLSFSFQTRKLEIDWLSRSIGDATYSAPSGILRQDSRHLLCGEDAFRRLNEIEEREKKGERWENCFLVSIEETSATSTLPTPTPTTEKKHFSTVHPCHLTHSLHQSGRRAHGALYDQDGILRKVREERANIEKRGKREVGLPLVRFSYPPTN